MDKYLSDHKILENKLIEYRNGTRDKEVILLSKQKAMLKYFEYTPVTIGLKIEKSNGMGKGGANVYYIRPFQECYNRSRRIKGFTYAEIEEKKERLINKWYAPIVIYYKIEGKIIGSNSKENALKEYWRVCEVENIGKQFEVKF